MVPRAVFPATGRGPMLHLAAAESRAKGNLIMQHSRGTTRAMATLGLDVPKAFGFVQLTTSKPRAILGRKRTFQSGVIVTCSDIAFWRLTVQLPRLAGVPDRGGDIAFHLGSVVEVVDGDEFAIGTLYGAWVAQVPTQAVVPQDAFGTPRLPFV